MANRETITDCRDTSYVQFSTDTTVYTVKTVGTVCEAAKKPHAKSIAVRYRGTRTKRTEIAMIRYMEQICSNKEEQVRGSAPFGPWIRIQTNEKRICILHI